MDAMFAKTLITNMPDAVMYSDRDGWTGYHQTMRTGRTRYGDGPTLSVPTIRKGGKRLSVAFTIVPFVDEDGLMTGIAAIRRDATAQFEKARALRKEVAELQLQGQCGRLTGGSRRLTDDAITLDQVKRIMM